MRYKPQDCWSIDFGVAFPRADALGAGYVAPKGFTFFISHKHGGDFTEQKLCNNRRYCNGMFNLERKPAILLEAIFGIFVLLRIAGAVRPRNFFMLRNAASTPGEQNVGAPDFLDVQVRCDCSHVALQ